MSAFDPERIFAVRCYLLIVGVFLNNQIQKIKIYSPEGMIKRNMYVLAVQDLQASLAFYRDVLGFAIREIGDDGWRLFERDGCQIMAGHCPDSTPAHDLGDHSYFAYLVVDNADEYYAEVMANGAELIKELRSEPWGMREFGLRTNDGHRIMIGQEVED